MTRHAGALEVGAANHCRPPTLCAPRARLGARRLPSAQRPAKSPEAPPFPATRARTQQWDKTRVAMATQVACSYTFNCVLPALEMKATMSRVILPEPDRAILARREGIVADLRRLVGGEAII